MSAALAQQVCHGMAWHALPIQLGKHQQANATSIEQVTKGTVFLSPKWVLPTFWFVTNYTLSHTPNKEDTGCLGHIPCIS